MDTSTLLKQFTEAAPISAGIFRMGIAGFLLLYTWVLQRHYELPFGKGLFMVPVVLVVRDFLSIFIHGFPPLFLMTDGVIVILYTFLLLHYNLDKKAVVTFASFSGGSLLVLSGMYIALPGVFLAYVALAVFAVAMSIWFGALLFSISIYNTPNAEFVVKNRMNFLTLFIVTRVFTLFDPSVSSPFTLYFVITLNYVPYIFIVLKYHLFFHSQSLERDLFINTYIDSLFDFMRTIGTAMTERIEVKNVLKYVVQTMMRFSKADAGLVMLRDAHDGTLKVEIMEDYFPPPFPVPAIVKAKLQGVQRLFESAHIKPGETILGKIAVENAARYVRKVSDEPLMDANAKDDTLFISSFIGVPLIVNKEVFGVAAIIRRKKDSFFADLDYERAKIFVEYASLTLDSLYNYSQLLEKQEIEREVNIAASIQKKLLPGRMPKAIQSMVAAFSKPAKGVSGDYYDIIPLTRAGKFALVVCDVAGKGVPASMIMVMIRTIVHLIAGSAKDAGLVTSWINRGIAGSIDIERFATLSYMNYDPVTKMLEYSNAGHHPALHYRKNTDDLARIDSPGLPVGLERETAYSNVRMKLHTGDVIMLYTDGIIEALNNRGEQYEEERLQAVFKKHLDESPKEILDAINEDLNQFVGNAKQHDDMTMIIFKAL